MSDIDAQMAGLTNMGQQVASGNYGGLPASYFAPSGTQRGPWSGPLFGSGMPQGMSNAPPAGYGGGGGAAPAASSSNIDAQMAGLTNMGQQVASGNYGGLPASYFSPSGSRRGPWKGALFGGGMPHGMSNSAPMGSAFALNNYNMGS